MNSNKGITPANYGDILVNPEFKAFARGSGNYNPPPKYEQSTDRGNAFANALNIYEENDNYTYLNEKTNTPSEQKYVVGSTGFHSESKPWTRVNPEGVGNQYTDWAMKSVQQDPSVLLNFFFSDENVGYLQNRIIHEVKQIKNVDISTQSKDELLIIMRNHYQRALSGWLPHEGGNKNEVYPRGETPCSLTERLSRLNKSVLEECIKQILSSISMYKQYYKDASSLPLPLSRPTHMSMKGSRVLSESVGYDSGHDFTRGINSFNERYNVL